jgi:hypothetical protein
MREGTDPDWDYGPWDVSSIMDYCNPLWNNGGDLSAWDIAGATAVYGGGHSISAVSIPGTRIETFYRGRIDAALWHEWWDPSGWHGPESLGGQITSDPAAVVWTPRPLVAPLFGASPSQTISVFAGGGDGAIWYRTLTASGTWSDWSSLGGNVAGAPAVAAVREPNTSFDNLHVLVREATASDLWVRKFDSTQGLVGVWQPDWTDISRGHRMTGTASAVSWGPGRLHVFFRAHDDGALGHLWLSGATWSAYDSRGGVIYGSPWAVSTSPNHLDIFVRGTNDHMFRRSRNGSVWAEYNDVGGPYAGNPVAVARTSSVIDVWTRGTDNGVYHLAWDGNIWYHDALGGYMYGSPAGTQLSSGHIDTFHRGTDEHEFHGYWDGSFHLWDLGVGNLR